MKNEGRDEHVAERLFLYRDASGWSQAELARRAGVSRTSLVLTESGQTTPRLPTLRRLARTFGVSVDEFLSDREPRPSIRAPAPELIARLEALPAADRRLILRGLWEDWTPDVEADARAMDRATEFQRETGASAEDVRRALADLDPLEARKLLVESAEHQEQGARYWQRLLFEAIERGDLTASQAAERAAVFSGAA